MSANFNEGLPPNYEQLKKMASNKSSWRTRLEAVEELGNWKCRQSIDILWRTMISDDVYKVKHRAFLKLQAFGEQVKLPKKKKGNLIPKINQKLANVKKSLPEEHTYEEFKNEFMKKRPVEYDTCEGDKEDRFDTWLKNVWKSLPQK